MQFTTHPDNAAIREARDVMVRMENRDIRAKILRLVYARQINGKEVLTTPEEYAALLDIDVDLVNVNIAYLKNSGLVEGEVLLMPGSTKIQTTRIWRLTHLGIQAVDEADDKSRKQKESSDNKVEVKDSTNTTVIIGGDENTVTQSASSQSIEMLPEGGNIMDDVGKWILLKLFHTQKKSMKLYGIVTTIVALAFGVPSFQPQVLMQYFGESNFLTVELGLMLATVVALALGPYLTILSSETTCPKCGFKFSWFRTKKVLKGHAELSDRGVENYESTYKCENPSCKYTKQKVREIREFRSSSSI